METLYIRAVSIIRSCTSTKQLEMAEKYYRLAIKRMDKEYFSENGLATSFLLALSRERRNKKNDLLTNKYKFCFYGKMESMKDLLTSKMFLGNCHLKMSECHLWPKCPNSRTGMMLPCADIDKQRKINWRAL